jgi:hypothetical protein
MAGGVEVPIVSTFNGKGITEARSELRRLESQAGSAGGVMGGLGKSAALLGGAMAAAFSVTAITEFFKSAAAGALEDEVAMKSLAVSLDNVNQGYRATDVEQFIDGLARASGTADGVLRPALQQIVTVTKDVTTAQGALKLAMDVAAGSSKSVAEVSAALSAAYSGNFTAITRLKTGIDANIIATKDMDKITAALSERYAGQASAAADTYQGKLNRISVAADEAKEKIGYSLLNALDSLSESFGGTGGVTKAIDGAGDMLANFITGLGLGIKGLNDFVKAAANAVGATDDAGLSLGDMAIAAFRLTPGLGLVVQTTEDLIDVGKTANEEAAKQAAALQVLSDRYMGLAGSAATAAAAMEAAKRQKAIGALGDRYTAYARSFPGTSISQTGGNLATYFDEPPTTGGGGGGVSSATTAATKAAEAFAAAQAKVKEKVDAARKSTQDAIRTFDDYAKSASDAISSKLSIGTAVDVFNQRAADVKTALKDLVDYQATLSTEQTDAERKKVEELQAIYRGAQEQAAIGGASIVDTFVKQAEKVSEFGNKMRQLLAAGLNETSFKEISAMNLENGMRTADAFLDGNMSENIRRTNEAVGSVRSVADQVGIDAAKQFAAVGIQMAVSMIEALMEAIGPKGKGRKALAAMMDSLAASLNRTATITVTTIGDTSGVASPGVAAPGDATALENLAGIGSDLGLFPGLDLSGVNWGALSGFADGGMASGTFLVGEAGPEIMSIGSRSAYVTPNSALGGGNSYSITVNAGVGDPRMIGQQVVQYIKKFEQASGPVFASA